MKIPTLSVLSIFALLGMALGMGYGYGSYGGFGAQYVPVAPGYGGQSNPLGIGQGGICKYQTDFSPRLFSIAQLNAHMS